MEIIGSLLLKLESIYNVTGKCLDDLVEQLHFICASSSQYIPNLLRSILTQNNCTVDENVISELVEKLLLVLFILTIRGGNTLKKTFILSSQLSIYLIHWTVVPFNMCPSYNAYSNCYTIKTLFVTY